MNTIEAIEFLAKMNISGDELFKMKIKNVKKLAKKLQRGEKFEAMWEEFRLYIEGKSEALTNKMNMLRQKYFPKEDK